MMAARLHGMAGWRNDVMPDGRIHVNAAVGGSFETAMNTRPGGRNGRGFNRVGATPIYEWVWSQLRGAGRRGMMLSSRKTNKNTKSQNAMSKHIAPPRIGLTTLKKIIPGARILVVDDDETIRNLHTAIFILEGYRVEMAADGADALDRLAAGQFDLVFTLLKSVGTAEMLAAIFAALHPLRSGLRTAA
jgi:CheY-like chemotaxis protein